MEFLQAEYLKEKDKANLLQRELNDKHKQIRMLDKGSEELDKILTMGRTDTHHRGLGYQGYSGNQHQAENKTINFISGGISKEKEIPPKTVEQKVKVLKEQESRGDNKVKRKMNAPRLRSEF